MRSLLRAAAVLAVCMPLFLGGCFSPSRLHPSGVDTSTETIPPNSWVSAARRRAADPVHALRQRHSGDC